MSIVHLPVPEFDVYQIVSLVSYFSDQQSVRGAPPILYTLPE